MAKSIGSIYIDIEARTAKLEEGAAKAEKRVKAMQDKLESAGKGGGDALDALGWKFLKFNLYAQAAANLLGAVSSAMADVNNNAQALGNYGMINSESVVTLERANVAWSKMKIGISQAYAETVNFGSEAVETLALVGDALDALKKATLDNEQERFGLVGRGPLSKGTEFLLQAENLNVLSSALSQAQRAREEYFKTTTAEDRGIAQAGSAGKFAQARMDAEKKLQQQQAAASFASLQNEDKIAKLRAQAAIASRIIASEEAKGGASQKYDSLQLLELKTREFELTEAANALEKEGKKRSLDLVRQLDVAQSRTAQAQLDSYQQELELEKQIAAIRATGAEAKARANGVVTDDEARSLQTLADLQNRLTESVKRRVTLEQLDAKAARDEANAAALVGLDRQERYNTLLQQAKTMRAAALADPNADRTDEGLREAAEVERKAREEYAAGAIADAEKLREVETTLVSLSREAGDESERQREVSAEILSIAQQYNQAMADKAAGKLLSKDQLATVERYVALTREEVQLGNKAREQALHMAELERKKVDAAKEYLTPAQEQAAVLSEIESLTRAIAANPYVNGTVMSPEQVALYDQLNEKQLRALDLLKQQREAWRSVGQDMVGTLWDGIKAGDSFEDTLKRMANALAEYIVQQALLKPLGNMLGNTMSGLFGSMNLFSGAAGASTAGMSEAGAALNGMTLPGRAVGGAVTAQPYLVGEKGPEIFRPAGSGSITPAKMTRDILTGGQPSFSTTYNIAAGVTASELRPILEQHARQVEASTRNSIMVDLARGGRRAAQFSM